LRIIRIGDLTSTFTGVLDVDEHGFLIRCHGNATHFAAFALRPRGEGRGLPRRGARRHWRVSEKAD